MDSAKFVIYPASTVSHSKSRYAEPVPAFEVEILDTVEGMTVVRYAGASKTRSQEKLEEAKEFILQLAAGGETHLRMEIIEKGTMAGHKRDALDAARKDLIGAKEVISVEQGRKKGIRLPSDVPEDIYTSGKSEDCLVNDQTDEDTPEVVQEESADDLLRSAV